VIIGTTDREYEGDLDHPVATDEEVDFILSNANDYLRTRLTRDDIVATYAGLRPLIRMRNKQDEDGISDHGIGSGQRERALRYLLEKFARRLLFVGVVSRQEADNDVGIDKGMRHALGAYPKLRSQMLVAGSLPYILPPRGPGQDTGSPGKCGDR